ncbi:hypothetical protein I6N95_04580 [Vagococcus sp. BWB3-3]|uniref:Uncharacterized protein n=1 Tax=Vagococcus allomyrinae TaxID=2794353 RepID=A0A940P8B3_9ENTE|nr:hypothetical protein [Vagococcus allomyrinae]MBP1040284.1 hypothetical protein [Vagococcus allomyrinae]
MQEKKIPVSSVELGERELQKSPVYLKMNKAEKIFYIEESLKIGKIEGQKYLNQNKDIYQLLSENQIIYEKKDSKQPNDDFILRGEIHFRKKGCKITVYDESIQSIYVHHQQVLPKHLVLSNSQALEIHLAHEFFHFLEFSSGATVSEKLGKMRIPLFFNFYREVDVTACSEIAAHAFAKQFCQLEVLPNYYDLHYLNQKELAK